MTDVTPRRALQLMAMSQAQKEVTYNQAMVLLDVMIGGVNSASTTAPPASPDEGDAYIIPTGATGVWATHVDEVAYWFGSQWNYLSELLFSLGLPVSVQDTLTYKKYSLESPNGWVTVAFGGATVAEFTDLIDVPGSYSGAGLKAVRVNSGGTGLEFYDPQGDGTDSSAGGFRGIPPTSRSANYTLTASDNGKATTHPAADTTARNFTSFANMPLGFSHTFFNEPGAGVVSIIPDASQTMYLAGAGTTGTRTLAAGGIATLVVTSSGKVMISGVGLT